MRLIVALAAVAAAACTAERPADMSASGEAALSAELAGRVAEDPVSCVSSRDLRGNRAVAGKIVFDGIGDRIYVNDTAGGCQGLNRGATLVLKSPDGRFCRGEIADVVDLTSNIRYGSCSLGEFTPYRRAG